MPAADDPDLPNDVIDPILQHLIRTVLAAIRPLLCPTCAAHTTHAAGAGDDTTEGDTT